MLPPTSTRPDRGPSETKNTSGYEPPPLILPPTSVYWNELDFLQRFDA